jgi:S-adenosylmethionine/arginine decarboxylase-like enzyme
MSSAGTHLIMDAYVRDSEVFTKERLERMFSQLIRALEMEPLAEAQFYEVPVDPAVLERVQRTGQFEDEGGITGFQVISTSHMSLHAWPLQAFFSLDAFSCRPFNAELAASIIKETLGVKSDNTTILQRTKPDR